MSSRFRVSLAMITRGIVKAFQWIRTLWSSLIGLSKTSGLKLVSNSSIAHWAPRFTTQGVDSNDFHRVTAPLDKWADWLDAWCANGDMHAALAKEAPNAQLVMFADGNHVCNNLPYRYQPLAGDWMAEQLARISS